jgi:REP element-mobilizing transposase RayT
MENKPRSSSLRAGRYTLTGQIYLLTTVTVDRQPVFADFQAARCLIHCLQQAQQLQHADTLAFVVMPDHLHWLMQLGPKNELSKCMAGVKSISARQLGVPVWQKGFHDHAVRKEEDLPALARYVVTNPVRAGLVQRVGQYPHWDAIWL